jgi:hypothetical protein
LIALFKEISKFEKDHYFFPVFAKYRKAMRLIDDNEKIIQYNPTLRGVNHCLCHQPYGEASADDRFGSVGHCRV